MKLKFSTISETDTTDWTSIVSIGAGKNRGWFFIPEVDDEVLVMFEHGDINRPLILGSLWNGKDKPPDKNPGGNPRRIIKSRQGSKITFDDENAKLLIEDGGGKGRITFDSNANKIVIEGLVGDVCFQTPGGETKIVSKSIEIKASQNIEIHSGKAMSWGANSVSINGSGGVTMSGSKVNLNCGNAQSPQAPTADPQDIADPYEARGSSQTASTAPAQTAAAPAAAPSAPPAAPSSSASSPSKLPPLEPQPVLISAAWSESRVAVSTAVKLSAACVDMAGKAATFKIKDADDDSKVVATVNGTCGDANVEASWTTPASGPPGRFVFEVDADGKQASSGLLTLINAVQVKLMLDEEPAAGVRVRLHVDQTGEEISGEVDQDGMVHFEEAPFGDYTLLLDN